MITSNYYCLDFFVFHEEET